MSTKRIDGHFTNLRSKKNRKVKNGAANSGFQGAGQLLGKISGEKDHFLATLAHELRNPLAPLRNVIEILKAPLDTKARDEVCQIMERQVKNMARMVDDLLDVSRITKGKLRLKKELVDISALLNQTLNVVKPTAASRNINLTLSFPSEPIYIQCDPLRLEQIFFNLLNNACKFTHIGGEVKIDLKVKSEEKVAEFRVHDNGVGISPEILPRIFDPFMQADQSLQRERGGLGIGLTLVKHLVELHGGKIEAQSEGLGKGCQIIVELPLPAAATLPKQPTVSKDEIKNNRAHSHRILVVDDNVDSARSLAVLLRRWGHEVAIAHEGKTIPKVAQEFRAQIILLDIGLPGMNGYEVAKTLRKQKESKKTLLIALSGYGDEEDRQKAMLAGFDYHFTKPARIPELRKLVSTRI